MIIHYSWQNGHLIFTRIKRRSELRVSGYELSGVELTTSTCLFATFVGAVGTVELIQNRLEAEQVGFHLWVVGRQELLGNLGLTHDMGHP